MSNKELKRRFNKDFLLLKKIIIENDPVGLIDGGAPHDEYDRYIFSILSFFEKNTNKESLGEYIYQVFDKAFTNMVDKNLCVKTANLFTNQKV